MAVDRRVPPLAVSLIGGGLVIMGAVHHLLESLMLGRALVPGVALVLSVGPAAGVVYLGWYLAGSELPVSEQWFVAKGTAAGATAGLVLIGLTFVIRLLEGRQPVEPAFPLLVGSGAGALAGGVIGVYAARVRATSQRIEAIFDNTYQLTGLLRPDGTLVELNETALRLLDGTKDDLLGRKLWEPDPLQAPDTEQRLKRVVERARDGEPSRERIHARTATRNIQLDLSVRPLFDSSGEVVLLISEARDITFVERQREHLDVLHRYLRHNLRNDLNVITAHANSLVEDHGDFSPSESARVIGRTGAGLSETAELVKQLSEIISEGDSEMGALSVKQVIEAAVAMASLSGSRVEYEGDMEATVAADRRLDDVLAECFDELHQFLDENGRIGIHVRPTGDAVEVGLLCERIDIPRIELSALDDVSARSATFHPKGIRFHLVKMAVEGYGGTVDYERDDPNRLEITLTLPKAEPLRDDASPSDRTTGPSGSRPPADERPRPPDVAIDSRPRDRPTDPVE